MPANPLAVRRRRAPGAAAALGLAVVVALGATACQPDQVTIAYRPAAGARYEYKASVTTTTTTELPDQAPTVDTEVVDLAIEQEVLSSDPTGLTRIAVSITRAGVGTRSFVVRFDRASQLTAVEQVEGVPSSLLGSLGLSEIFPPAAGAPPDRPLRPGDRWVLDELVQLSETAEPVRLSGSGRLAALGVLDGNDTATIHSTTNLPFLSTTTSTDGTQVLEGRQATTTVATYDLHDGAVRRSRAVTEGSYRLILTPPAGLAGAPVEGTIIVAVTSTVERVA